MLLQLLMYFSSCTEMHCCYIVYIPEYTSVQYTLYNVTDFDAQDVSVSFILSQSIAKLQTVIHAQLTVTSKTNICIALVEK